MLEHTKYKTVNSSDGYVAKRSTATDSKSVLVGVRRFDSCRTHLTESHNPVLRCPAKAMRFLSREGSNPSSVVP